MTRISKKYKIIVFSDLNSDINKVTAESKEFINNTNMFTLTVMVYDLTSFMNTTNIGTVIDNIVTDLTETKIQRIIIYYQITNIVW